MVDYNEYPLLPSSMGDEDSERIWHGDGSDDPITDEQTAPVNNSSYISVTSQSTDNKVVHAESVTICSTITKESAVLEGSAASLSVNDSSERQDIHNGRYDFDELEEKVPTRRLDLYPYVSQPRRFESRYAPCTIPSMPSPIKWPVADGNVAPPIVRITIDEHNYYVAFRTWKKEEKRLDRTFPIHVLLFPNGTTDLYEAAFLQRFKPHPEEEGSGRRE